MFGIKIIGDGDSWNGIYVAGLVTTTSDAAGRLSSKTFCLMTRDDRSGQDQMIHPGDYSICQSRGPGRKVQALAELHSTTRWLISSGALPDIRTSRLTVIGSTGGLGLRNAAIEFLSYGIACLSS